MTLPHRCGCVTMATSDFWRRSTYRSSPFSSDYFVIRHLAEFLERSIRENCSRGSVVADIGCGEQPYRALIERLGATYIGIDIGQNRSGTVDRLGSITDIPADSSDFDLILCSEVLEHIVDSERAIAELARVLRPGGRLILTMPFAYPLHEEPFDYVRLTPNAIATLTQRHGLRTLALDRTGNELEVLATVWGNLWSGMEIASGRSVRRLITAGMRTPANLLTAAISRMLGPKLPRKYFLNVVCLFEKCQSSA